ncbi:MAG: lipoyl synthase [candidate division WOR-3 bacterium]|nr:lipoyl synthase [candidate division WOR-3 bacterium]
MRKPDWLRIKLPSGAEFDAVNTRLKQYGLHTVCSSARCPNLADCWGRGTATFMILGDTCTRHCRFCSVATGNPGGAVDETEPGRVAQAVAELGLKYVVLTSVDRDDLSDLGAGGFVATLEALRSLRVASGSDKSDLSDSPSGQRSAVSGRRVLVEILTPDFGGRDALIEQVADAAPDVFGHNLETIERLTPHVRDRQASYRMSLGLLEAVKRLAPEVTTKSGLMVGLGETGDEIRQAMRDLRFVGCDIVTVGQYLQPDRRSLPVERYVTPEEFAALEQEALAMGFKGAFCGPLVRSSYRAAEVAAAGKPEARSPHCPTGASEANDD